MKAFANITLPLFPSGNFKVTINYNVGVSLKKTSQFLCSPLPLLKGFGQGLALDKGFLRIFAVHEKECLDIARYSVEKMSIIAGCFIPA